MNPFLLPFTSCSCSRTWLDLLHHFPSVSFYFLRAVRGGINPTNQVTSSLGERRYTRQYETTPPRMFAFASFKRSSASAGAPGGTTTGSEKDSGANSDYADLEKRPDGRWRVQNRETRRRETCCGFLPAHVGVLLFTTLALMIGGVFMGVTATNIAQNGTSSPTSRGGDGLTDIPQAGRCGMSTFSLLPLLYRSGHSSSSPACSGTFALVAIFVHSLPCSIVTQFAGSMRHGRTA